LIYVDKPEAVAEAASAIRKAPWAAVDTEADSLHHYAEKLCLVQVSVPGADFVLDPLATDLSEAARALSEKPLLFHGADFDVRMIKRAYGVMPATMFDTLLAAQLLGYDRQGYADLAERHCGVKLSKSSQKADWSRRPLDAKMLDYAVNDTKHLDAIRQAMTAELAGLGRLEWHRQSCAKLLKSLAASQDNRLPPEREWQIRGSRELKGRALTLLKALWYWREAEAKRHDRPTFKVLNTEYLIQIAKWAAEHPGQDVGDMPNAPSNVRRQLRGPLNALLREAMDHPQAVFTEAPRQPSKRWTNADEKRLLLLKADRQSVAAELKIHPSLVATNAILEVVASKAPKSVEEIAALDLFMPWQIEVFGESILSISKGEKVTG
jgi:ribonuclease D